MAPWEGMVDFQRAPANPHPTPSQTANARLCVRISAARGLQQPVRAPHLFPNVTHPRCR